MNRRRVLVVGAGFTGSVIARQLADAGRKVLVVESRGHVAGNCHTSVDEATGIMVHRYGPHIFHTDREDVWNYVRRFGEFKPFTLRVKSSTDKGIFSLPVNLHTINQFFGTKLTPVEARRFIGQKADKSIGIPINFEEQALKFVGRELYEAFFKGYTRKQWGCAPTDVPASVLARLPVRFDYNDNYFNCRFQGIPVDGYTPVVARMLDHPGIVVELNRGFHPEDGRGFAHVFHTGPVDAYHGYTHGHLGYRTVGWEEWRGDGDLQGCAIMTYPGSEPHTRISEHKHFTPWRSFEASVAFVEYSSETRPGETGFYPKRLASDMALLRKYQSIETPGVTFAGRLGTYRYLDMDKVVGEAMDLAAIWLATP